MQTVLTQLSRLSSEPFDCIVHVGAGADADATDYSALNPKHVVLIEANPEAHAALAERFQNASNVTVVNALVAPQSGETAFHRFSLPSFNAPLGLGRLREIYPRIGLVEELRIQSQTLCGIVPESVLGARNLLIFDIPGQEAVVLRELPLEFLERFCSMVVLASAESWQEGSEPLEVTLATLKEKSYEVASEHSDDPAWPCVVLVRDAAKAAMRQELDKRARLLVAKATQIHQQTEQINALTAERDTLATRVSSLESERADLATRHSSLATALEELRGQHSSLSTLQSSLVAERDALAQERDQVRSERDALAQERNQAATERDDLATKLSTLEPEHSELLTRHSSLVRNFEDLQVEHSTLKKQCESFVAEREILALQLENLNNDLKQTYITIKAERRIVDTILCCPSSLLDAKTSHSAPAQLTVSYPLDPDVCRPELLAVDVAGSPSRPEGELIANKTPNKQPHDEMVSDFLTNLKRALSV